MNSLSTMSAAVAALSSSPLCMSSQKSSNLEQPNNSLAAKPYKSLLQKHPLHSQTHANLSLEFKEKVLCLEIMGVDSGRALSQNPALHAASLHSLQAIISFLQYRGIHQKDMGRIFGMCPQILTSSVKTDLNPVFRFLSQDLRVPDDNFRRVVNKCPRILACSVKDQLRPTLLFLQGLGFRDLGALSYQDPMLLVSSVENTLIPKLECLMSLGFPRRDAVGMVLRCPNLFTFSIENNFKPKFEYFVKEMKGDLEELKGFPQYFSFSLEGRIKPRHIEAVKIGMQLPLPVLLKSTDEEFLGLIGQAS